MCRRRTSLGYAPCQAINLLGTVRSARRQAVQNIADWLEKLGMSEYAERFAENGVDLSVLLI